MIDAKELLTTATTIAREAGDIALDMQTRLERVEHKGPKDLVTEADMKCDHHIRERIEQHFPGHGIVSEELEQKAGTDSVVWYVDPIDGTVNYSRGIPIWGISIGIQIDGTTTVGVAHLPALNETYTAVCGEGAFRNGMRIGVGTTDRLSEAIISNGDFNVGATQEERERLNRANTDMHARQADAMQRVKCFGSALVECAWVASGRLDAYLMLRFNSWDVAAGLLLIEEAGGRVSDVAGNPWSFESTSLLASNGHIHEAALQALSK
jgi:myo-inositol-1(or 4)-monophosphatase